MSTAGGADGVLIDTRRQEDYLACHVCGAYNLPLASLRERSFELPPRYRAFRVVTTASERETCEAWFQSHNVPWPVAEYLVWEFLPGVRPAVHTTSSASGSTATTSAPSPDLPLVWGVARHYAANGVVPLFPFSPAPVVREELDYLRRVLGTLTAANPDGGRIILDVGCGAGRDAITLAYAFPDHRVIALDNLARALERVSQFSEREARSNVLPFRAVLKGKGTLVTSVADALASTGGGRGEGAIAATTLHKKRRRHGVKQGNNVSLILLSRFLNRDVMYSDCVQLLRPGGYILIHHFLMSCVKPKQPHHKLEEGELAREFSARGLEIVRDDVYVAPDDGRELTMFVARKPESGRSTVTFN